jgi:hypothetical protein
MPGATSMWDFRRTTKWDQFNVKIVTILVTPKAAT